MDKERSVDYWANEGGKRIEFVALANGDVRINFNTSDGRTYESLTLASYRYASVVEAIGKFHKGNTMNNKELTERVEDIKKKYIHYSTSIGDSNIFYMSEDDYRSFERELTDLLAKAILSNDEIKREVVEGFVRALLLQCWNEDYVNDGRWKENNLDNAIDMGSQDFNAFVEEYLSHLTQKENNE